MHEREGNNTCGIAGIRKYGNKPIEEHMIRLCLTALEKRGNDATGVALQQKDGSIQLYKADDPAWTFVKSKAYNQWIDEHLKEDTICALMHTRAATKGSPRVSNNNHPMFAGKTMVIHNGKLENDDELFRTMDLKREADTDSDILRAIIDKHGITEKGIDVLGRVRGSCAIAAISPDYPGVMLVGRSGSPLCVGSTDDFFIFASEKNVIHRAMRPIVVRFRIPFQQVSLNMAFGPYPDSTIWIMGNEGQELHAEFKTYYGTYKDPIRRVYTGYKERQDEWTQKARVGTTNYNPNAMVLNPTQLPVRIKEGDGEKILLSCPSCDKPLVLGRHQLKMNLDDLLCPKEKGGCGNPLSGAKVN